VAYGPTIPSHVFDPFYGPGRTVRRHNNSLQLTRLACGKLERDLPAKLHENEWGVARAAGQLSSRPFGGIVSFDSPIGVPWIGSKLRLRLGRASSGEPT
jgi:hypothetical protein